MWVGDGTYLMMPTEIVTAVQEHVKLIIVLVDNHGFGSIGGLSQSLGSAGFGTRFRYRTDSGQLDGEPLPIDYAANARSLGAVAIKAAPRMNAGIDHHADRARAELARWTAAPTGAAAWRSR